MRLRNSIIALFGTWAIGQLLWQQVNEQDLTGQRVIITGGSRGLGLLLAREFALEGCRVAICARDEEELAQARQRLLDWGIHACLAIACDVSQRDEIEAFIRTVETQFGGVDILVNNAGIIQSGPIESQTIEDFEEAMQIMYWGTVYSTMALLPRMLQENRGHIVNIASIGGKVSVPHLLPYGSAKFATVGFSEGLTAELIDTDVKVTTVVPGLMRTGSYLNAWFKGRHRKEFIWFSVSDNLPVLSIDAEHAARKIVAGVKRGAVEVIFTLPANILVRLHGLFPALTIRLLGWMGYLVLPPGYNTNKRRGMTIQPQINSRLFHFLTARGRSAARRFNQYESNAARSNGHGEASGSSRLSEDYSTEN